MQKYRKPNILWQSGVTLSPSTRLSFSLFCVYIYLRFIQMIKHDFSYRLYWWSEKRGPIPKKHQGSGIIKITLKRIGGTQWQLLIMAYVKKLAVPIFQLSHSTFVNECFGRHTKPLCRLTILTHEEDNWFTKPWESRLTSCLP